MNVDKEVYSGLFAVASKLEPPLKWRWVTFAPDNMADTNMIWYDMKITQTEDILTEEYSVETANCRSKNIVIVRLGGWAQKHQSLSHYRRYRNFGSVHILYNADGVGWV